MTRFTTFCKLYISVSPNNPSNKSKDLKIEKEKRVALSVSEELLTHERSEWVKYIPYRGDCKGGILALFFEPESFNDKNLKLVVKYDSEQVWKP